MCLLGRETVLEEQTTQDFENVRYKRKRKTGGDMEVENEGSTTSVTKRPSFPPVDASTIMVTLITT